MTQFEGSSIFGETFNQELQASLVSTESLGDVLADVELTQNWNPPAGLPGSLRQVSKLIATREQAGVEREAFAVKMDGFDHHGGVYEPLQEKFEEIDRAMRIFQAELKGLGVWQDVVIVSASDFARTLTSNGAGSDHGWGSNQFIAGGPIEGGQILGKYISGFKFDSPEIIDNRGRVVPTTPWESVWNAIAEWFGVETEHMDEVLPNRPNFPEQLLTMGEVFRAPDDPLLATSPPSPPAPPSPPPDNQCHTTGQKCGGTDNNRMVWDWFTRCCSPDAECICQNRFYCQCRE